MRSPLPISAQIDLLRAFLRVLNADVRRASREIYKHDLKRRISPFVQHLRYRRQEGAYELLEVATECLGELRHAQELSVAGFFPGDQVTIEVVLKDHERPPERQIVYDKTACYEMWQLTKAAELFKRGPRSVSPSGMIEIRPCSEPLPPETERRAAEFRAWAKEFVGQTRDVGKIDDLLAKVRERAARRRGL